MSAAEAWTAVLDGAQISAAVKEKLLDLGYKTQETFQFKDETVFEAFVKHLLLREKVIAGVDENTWMFNPLVGGRLEKLVASGATCEHAKRSSIGSAWSCRGYGRFYFAAFASRQEFDGSRS